MSSDPALDEVSAYFAAGAGRFGPVIRRALDEVIAAGRTRRWNLDQCNNQEKAYVGVSIENLLRAEFNLPEGPRGLDYEVVGADVDCKWSRSWGGWQIPNEAVGHLCLLVYGDDLENEMAVGVIRITDDILVGGNRDQKRTIQRPEGLDRTVWVVQRGPSLPENFLMGLRRSDRDAILTPRGGDDRAVELLRRCEGTIIHRHTVEAVAQQLDPTRRFRGESRKKLRREGYAVLNGRWSDQRAEAESLGGPVPQRSDQWVCLRTDGSSPAFRAAAERERQAEASAYRKSLKKDLARLRRERTQRKQELRALMEAEALVEAEAKAEDREEHAAVKHAEEIAARVVGD